MQAIELPWSEGIWTHPPEGVTDTPDGFLVTASEGSDAWRHTSYGFVHETEHALVAAWEPGTAMEVEFDADFTEQFDQAGIFVHGDDEHWVKAGVEFADGALQLGAVVTAGRSDWSVAPVPDWSGRRVVVRVSWSGESLTVRAGLAGQGLRLVRLIPWSAPTTSAGPFTCAPTRSGLTVAFHAWRLTDADSSLH